MPSGYLFAMVFHGGNLLLNPGEIPNHFNNCGNLRHFHYHEPDNFLRLWNPEVIGAAPGFLPIRIYRRPKPANKKYLKTRK